MKNGHILAHLGEKIELVGSHGYVVNEVFLKHLLERKELGKAGGKASFVQ